MSSPAEQASSRAWTTFRIALFIAGASLLFYVPYRYLAGAHPGAVGELYGTIFPASALLALAGMTLAVKPTACGCGGRRRMQAMLAGGMTFFAGAWMATGLMCVSYLASTTLATPLRGVLETFHMSAQHIFLSIGVVFVAWSPDEVAGWFGAADPDAHVAPPEAPPLAEQR